jgi:hypothetical protein
MNKKLIEVGVLHVTWSWLVLVNHEHADIYGILIGYDNIDHQHTCVDGLLSVSVCFST